MTDLMGLKRKFPKASIMCDLCKRPTKTVYFTNFGDLSYKFCSSNHAQIAAKNFQENKDRGVSVSIESPEEEPMVYE